MPPQFAVLSFLFMLGERSAYVSNSNVVLFAFCLRNVQFLIRNKFHIT